MRHLFILNPVAGGGKRTARARETIEAVMGRHGDRWSLYETRGPMDACEKVRQEAAKGDPLRVYACGGDGTLNECVNGMVGHRHVAVTHYPTGTGNDFIKLFDHGREDFSRLECLLDGKVMPLDVIDCGERYGLNLCSVGIDARIGTDVHKYSALPLVGGRTGYLVSLVANLVQGVATELEVEVAGRRYRQPFSLICACNGRFYGGMFNPVPEAEPDDGLLDILLVDKVSRLRFMRLVGRYARGRYRELADVITHVRSDALTIRGGAEFVVNVDGEALRTDNIRFSLLPGAVNFLAPQSATFNRLDTIHLDRNEENGEN